MTESQIYANKKGRIVEIGCYIPPRGPRKWYYAFPKKTRVGFFNGKSEAFLFAVRELGESINMKDWTLVE